MKLKTLGLMLCVLTFSIALAIGLITVTGEWNHDMPDVAWMLNSPVRWCLSFGLGVIALGSYTIGTRIARSTSKEL